MRVIKEGADDRSTEGRGAAGGAASGDGLDHDAAPISSAHRLNHVHQTATSSLSKTLLSPFPEFFHSAEMVYEEEEKNHTDVSRVARYSTILGSCWYLKTGVLEET